MNGQRLHPAGLGPPAGWSCLPFINLFLPIINNNIDENKTLGNDSQIKVLPEENNNRMLVSDEKDTSDEDVQKGKKPALEDCKVSGTAE